MDNQMTYEELFEATFTDKEKKNLRNRTDGFKYTYEQILRIYNCRQETKKQKLLNKESRKKDAEFKKNKGFRKVIKKKKVGGFKERFFRTLNGNI